MKSALCGKCYLPIFIWPFSRPDKMKEFIIQCASEWVNFDVFAALVYLSWSIILWDSFRIVILKRYQNTISSFTCSYLSLSLISVQDNPWLWWINFKKLFKTVLHLLQRSMKIFPVCLVSLINTWNHVIKRTTNDVNSWYSTCDDMCLSNFL